jgi:hypothetical protein
MSVKFEFGPAYCHEMYSKIVFFRYKDVIIDWFCGLCWRHFSSHRVIVDDIKFNKFQKPNAFSLGKKNASIHYYRFVVVRKGGVIIY